MKPQCVFFLVTSVLFNTDTTNNTLSKRVKQQWCLFEHSTHFNEAAYHET